MYLYGGILSPNFYEEVLGAQSFIGHRVLKPILKEI